MAIKTATKVRAKVKQLWCNTAKGAYTWHHTVLLEDERGALYLWTYTNVIQKHPSEGYFVIEGEQAGLSDKLKSGQFIIRITNVKVNP